MILDLVNSLTRYGPEPMVFSAEPPKSSPACATQLSLRMLQEGRLTRANAQALSTYLTEYVRETSGVQDVTDVRFSVEGHRFGWECSVLTEYGSASVSFDI